MDLTKRSSKKSPAYHFFRCAILCVLLFLANTPLLPNTLQIQRFAMAYHSEGRAYLSEYSSTEAQSTSQTDSAQKTSTGVITGKVTIKGKGVPDISVALRSDDFKRNKLSSRKVTTDQEGNYQITNVAPGAYQVVPIALGFVISGQRGSMGQRRLPGPTGKSLIIAEGETIQNVDFALTRGGVITGKVTDSEGRPLIEQPINAAPVARIDQAEVAYSGDPQTVMTDDRGVYRVFGLTKGRYLVSAGQQGSFGRGFGNSRYKETFYPAVNEPAKATLVEVSEGSEATGIDITVNVGPTNTYEVSGRIVDGTTGKPVPNVMLGLQMSDENGSSSSSMSAWTSNQLGEFRLQNLNPGKYSIYLEQQSDFRADPISIEIIDQDVTGLVIKTSRGTTVSGVIVFESGDAKVQLVKPDQLFLQTFVQRQSQEGGVGRSVIVKPDGSFRIGGLQAGTVNFMVNSFGNRADGFRIMRVERDGVVQLRGIEIKDEEEVTGVKIIVRVGTGSVRGIIRAENGELPLPPRLALWLSVPGEDATNSLPTLVSNPKVDSRGHFLFENLAAGAYEVNASVFTSQGRVSTKQQVNVADGAVTDVTITLNLKPNAPEKEK